MCIQSASASASGTVLPLTLTVNTCLFKSYSGISLRIYSKMCKNTITFSMLKVKQLNIWGWINHENHNNSVCIIKNTQVEDRQNLWHALYRIIKQLRLEGALEITECTPCSKHGSPRTNQVYSIFMNRDCTTSLDNLCQCLTILTVKKKKKYFHISDNSLCFSLCPLPLKRS